MALGAAVVVGALAAGVTIAATGGLATIAVIGAVVSLSGGVGELIGSLSWCTNKAGQIFKGSGNVFTNGKPAARAHLDTATCDKHGSVPQVIAQGSRTVHINGQPAARVGDRTVCDGKISAGSGNVNIGGLTEETDDISPEVALWVHVLVAGIGFGSATVLRSFGFAVGGLIGGLSGGIGGSILGGRLFGEDSNKQKVMAFAGAWLGGGLGAKGGEWVGARYQIKQEGLGSLLGNVKIVKKPLVPADAAERISPELYDKLRTKTPSLQIRKMVNKGVVLPMDDPALPGLQITKALHAEHVVSMKTITEMDGFSNLTFNDQVAVLNYKPNFIGLSETANTSKGAKSYAEWTSYKKGGVEVDPAFRSSMMRREAELEPEIQSHIYSLLDGY
ncbi:PAAR domain-containing protein [Pseudomonas sp. W5-36]|uniref:PAAR domain-containing protein n=1 Tax=Pseudomonas sp. W5-36 TaxID=3097455 RepID=UPI003979B048